MNKALGILDGFLKAGTRECSLVLWHHDVYSTTPYRLGQQVPTTETGGTEIKPVLKHILKHKPDMAIIITDGYYANFNHLSLSSHYPTIVWVISSQGDLDHPLKELGRTIKLPK
jgi:predicted metal-dependent peptidase